MDGLRTSHPIYVPVNNPDQINEIFDSIQLQQGRDIFNFPIVYLRLLGVIRVKVVLHSMCLLL